MIKYILSKLFKPMKPIENNRVINPDYYKLKRRLRKRIERMPECDYKTIFNDRYSLIKIRTHHGYTINKYNELLLSIVKNKDNEDYDIESLSGVEIDIVPIAYVFMDNHCYSSIPENLQIKNLQSYIIELITTIDSYSPYQQRVIHSLLYQLESLMETISRVTIEINRR